jgi:hypothetical protein
MPLLGHAQTYDAAIYRQGGKQLWTRVGGLTAVEWGRKLDDYSEGKITVSKGLSDDAVCGKLGQVNTWKHELCIFRDAEMVWCGPIVQKSEFRDRFVFNARDMIAWFDRRYNPVPYNWVPVSSQNPGGWGEANVGGLIWHILADCFDLNGAAGHRAEHDPNLYPYLLVDSTPGINASVQAVRVREKNVGTLIRDLLQHGIDMFTIGRFIVIRHISNTRANVPYRLTQDDFIGDLEIREMGLDAATRGIVVGGQAQTTDGANNPAAGQTLPPIGVAGGVDAQFGLIEKGVQSQTATSQKAVDSLARQVASYGNPPPVAIIVPDKTQLSPTANITIRDLVPARRLNVRLDRFCTPVESQFVISEVAASCTVDDSGISEQVQVSFTTDGVPLSTLSGAPTALTAGAGG